MSIFLLFLCVFITIIIYNYKPRTLIFGLMILLSSSQTIIVQFNLGFEKIALILSISLGMILLIIPSLLLIALLVKYIRLIQRYWQWIALLFILALVLLLNVRLSEILSVPLLNWGLGFLLFSAILAILFINVYILTSWLNLNLRKKSNIDYIIVLGAGLLKDKVTPLLARRIDKAIEVHNAMPNSILIMSGGQGSDELIPEGKAMANYAIARGVPTDSIIIEGESVNTEENILFSKQLMKTPKQGFAVVSTHYHILRAEMLARKHGLQSQGYGAVSGKDWVFNANAIIREIFAVLYLNLKLVITLSIAFIITYSVFYHLYIRDMINYLINQYL